MSKFVTKIKYRGKLQQNLCNSTCLLGENASYTYSYIQYIRINQVVVYKPMTANYRYVFCVVSHDKSVLWKGKVIYIYLCQDTDTVSK